jgi:hypothetical protein
VIEDFQEVEQYDHQNHQTSMVHREMRLGFQSNPVRLRMLLKRVPTQSL